MTGRYEVIEAKLWRRDDGRSASIYGACPWQGQTERSRWTMESTGWTVRDRTLNVVGIGRVPWQNRADAEVWVASQE